MREESTPARRSAPLVLYDGECALCTRQAGLLRRITPPGTWEFVPLQSPALHGILPAALTPERLRAQMYVLEPGGRAYGGAAAVARVLGTVPLLGVLAHLYDFPLLRPLADYLYAWVAHRRYRLFGRRPACRDDACRLAER